MYFELIISVKCCPKLHIKQLTLHLSVRSGWVGGGRVTDEKGGPGKGGGQDPLTPPSGHAYDAGHKSTSGVASQSIPLLIHDFFCLFKKHVETLQEGLNNSISLGCMDGPFNKITE